MPERDNRMVWDGRLGHYEVWYATLSHRASRTGFWIRHTLRAPHPSTGGKPYAQLWFARFDSADPSRTFGVNRKHPIADLRTQAEPFSVAIGESELRHDGMHGAIEGAGHSASWKLSWNPSWTTLRQLPSFAYKLAGRVDSLVLSPNPSLAIDGEIIVDGERYLLEGDPGAQSHVWGRKHAYSWAWSHVGGFEGADDAMFESLSIRLKRGQVILPTLTMFTLQLDGEEIALREPWALPVTRSDYGTGHYTLSGHTSDTRVEAKLSCRPEDMILTEYLDPDGDPAFCHNTCAGSAEIVVKKRSPFVGRWRDHKTLRAEQLAHFEWGARAGDIVRVRKTHQSV